MRAVHLLRKLNPAEWGGTETAMQRMFEGLRGCGVSAVAYCPRLDGDVAVPPLPPMNCEVRRFRAFVPILGISRGRKRQLISVGGNLMSFDLMPSLWRERDASIIHAHTLGRIGGIARAVARRRRLPFVISIHGGVLDLPARIRQAFNEPLGGWEWGKIFGWLLRSRDLLRDADAVVTCNENEATLLRKAFPDRRIVVQPHGIPLDVYRTDHRAAARQAFPAIRNRQVLLCVGRIDPIKNQGWLLDQAPEIFRCHPDAMLVLVGACTDEPYGAEIERKIAAIGDRVLLTGGLPPNDPRLIGLLQEARVVLLPSASETFGLVLLEAWAAGAVVIASRASGPAALVEHGRNGWLFDLDRPADFHAALDIALENPALTQAMAGRGAMLSGGYSIEAVAARLRRLYEQLIEEKRCAT